MAWMAAQRVDFNEAILRAKGEQELEKGARYLEGRLQRLVPGPVGMLLNPLAGVAYRAVGREEVLARARGQMERVFAAARTHGQAPEAIYDGHLSAYLQHDEAWARADRAHQAFPELQALMQEVYVARVEPVSALLHGGMGEDYEALVRSVFHDREAARTTLQREAALMGRVFDLAQRQRGLLHLPPVLGHEVLHVLRDTYAWYQDNLERSLDRVYARG